MKTLVVLPMGAHPFHPGHYALYKQAQDAFPGSDVYIAATADTSQRPFPFQIKQKLAKLSGVPENRFVQVKSPFQAREITANLDPANTQLIFVRSEKDANKPPQAGGVKKDGNLAYLQPYEGQDELAPMNQHAYMAYLPTVEFGPGMTSATEIRNAWPRLNEKRKTALVMSLYPKTQGNLALAANVVKLLDTAMGTEELNEAQSVAQPGQLVTIIKAPRMLDLLPGETFEVSSSDADGVTLKHGLGTKFDNVKFPHGTYKITKAQGVAEAAGGSREKFTDLSAWAKAAKQQGLRVGPANGDSDYSYWAVGKGGEVFGKFVTTRVPQNNHGYIKKQGVAEGDTGTPPGFLGYVLSNSQGKFSDIEEIEDLFDYAYLSDLDLLTIADGADEEGISALKWMTPRMAWLLKNINDKSYLPVIKPLAVAWMKTVAPAIDKYVKDVLNDLNEGLAEADDHADLLVLADRHEKTGRWEWSQGNFEGAKQHYAKANALRDRVKKEQGVADELNEFAPDDSGGSRKFIPWPEFIDAVKQIVGKDFSVKENVVKSTIKARFIPHDPMEYGPTMLYSYYEARAGRNKGAVSTRGSIQVGKYFDKGSYFNSSDPDIQNQLLTSFSLLKGHPFERHFDLTFDNIYKIANIIMGNTEGAYQMPQQQSVNEDYVDEKK